MNNTTSMFTGFWLFIALFGVTCVAHLVLCYLKMSFWRKVTKPFCMVLLGAAMAFLAPNRPLIYLSCWVSAVGDLLLIRNKEPKFFLTGAAVFAVAHTMNAVNQTKFLSYRFPSYAWAIFAAVVLIAALIGYFSREKGTALAIATVCPAYACFHFLNIALAVMTLFGGAFVPYRLMILLGYILYVCSDLIVNYSTNKNQVDRGDFYIMLTYLPAQTLIYLGLGLAFVM